MTCRAKTLNSLKAYDTLSSSQNNLDDFTEGNIENNISVHSNIRTSHVSYNNLDSFLNKNYQRIPNVSESNLDNFGNSNFQKSTVNKNHRNIVTFDNLKSTSLKATNVTGRVLNAFMENTSSSSTHERLNMTESTILNTLRSVRTPIVNYQEARGVPKTEQISFISLITSLCTHAYTAAITILVMLWNLAPLLDGFVYFARFAIDKLIDIFETEDQKEKAMKTAVFAGEIIVIFFLIFLIVGLIFMPVYVLTARIVSKIWGMIAW